MRKTLIIIATGIIIALFPLFALPPRIEAWILLILGIGIIVFGLYERIADREKNLSNTDESPRQQIHREQDSSRADNGDQEMMVESNEPLNAEKTDY